MECYWFCGYKAGLKHCITYCSAHKCGSSVIQPLVMRYYKKQGMGKAGSVFRLQNALLF